MSTIASIDSRIGYTREGKMVHSAHGHFRVVDAGADTGPQESAERRRTLNRFHISQNEIVLRAPGLIGVRGRFERGWPGSGRGMMRKDCGRGDGVRQLVNGGPYGTKAVGQPVQVLGMAEDEMPLGLEEVPQSGLSSVPG